LGLFAKRYYRLFFNLVAVLSLMPVLWVMYHNPDYPLYFIPAPLVFITLLLQVAAASCAAAALLQTGLGDFLGINRLTPGNAESPAPVLNVNGFYRWVRHPVYTFALLFIWLTPMLTVNLLALILGFTLYVIIGIYFEERKLLRAFGQDYADYRARTPMLFPPYF
jgi:protein-S-isoprenylcysteine O-methyltransferase Ste14